MATIITFSPLQPPTRSPATGKGKSVVHECEDSTGHRNRQLFMLGSIKGVFYLDAFCFHCGAHLVWVENEEETPAGGSP